MKTYVAVLYSQDGIPVRVGYYACPTARMFAQERCIRAGQTFEEIAQGLLLSEVPKHEAKVKTRYGVGKKRPVSVSVQGEVTIIRRRATFLPGVQ